jgi:DNA (cytosine-5)-methyltransferase 1
VFKIEYFSMFSGIGGFELGIQKAHPDWKCVGYSEIDKFAIQTYEEHFPEHTNYGDATKIKAKKLPDFDLLCGGFPCQAFSIAGKRLGFKDTRGTLFYDIARIVKVKRPQHLFLENVKGLLNHSNGRTFATILATLDELGYDAEWQVLNSKYFGVPQNRERVFIIGHLRGKRTRQIFPLRQGNKMFDKSREFQEQIASTLTTAQAKIGRGMNMIELTKNQSQGARIYHTDRISQTICGGGGGMGAKTGLYAVLTPDRKDKRQNGRRFKNEGEEMFNLTGQDKHGIMIQSHSPRCGNPKKGRTGLLESSEHCFILDSSPHYVNKIRKLTPIECERLQGFPDNWTIGSDNQRYRQCGNAVTVNVIECIARCLPLDVKQEGGNGIPPTKVGNFQKQKKNGNRKKEG